MAASLTRSRKPKVRKLYRVRLDYRFSTRPGWKMENIAALTGGGRVLFSPQGKRGFPSFCEPPRLLIDKSLGRSPVDWELFHDFWLVSDRMKDVVEAVDSEGVVFQKCQTHSLRGQPTPVYWLCAIVRVIDVIDEEKSCVTVLEDGTDFRHYDPMARSTYVFREEDIGSAHIFWPRFLPTIICDQEMKDACNAAGIRGLGFGYAYGNWSKPRPK